MTTPEDVRAHILAFVSAPPNTPDEFDLRRNGSVDSLQFLRLIDDLETRIGTAIDLAELEPEYLTKLGALSRHVAAQLRGDVRK